VDIEQPQIPEADGTWLDACWQWLLYTADVSRRLAPTRWKLRVASASTGGTLRVEVDE